MNLLLNKPKVVNLEPVKICTNFKQKWHI